ncbi:ABC transporter ATP-binding protein [Komagataeibacter swingsii]|uniref:ABC transporter ATP-binding protein n=1 Tax=Komagataeibacter swingsii TaxID=215220 RepID=UPI001ABF987C|nr:ABC transporter ATP-binding protein [Komagataeibacter swingsii]
MAQWRSYRLLLPFLRPYVYSLLFVVVVSLMATCLGLAQPWLSKLMIDQALLPRDMTALVRIAVLMVVVAVANYALNIIASYRYVATSAAMLFDIRAALLRHLQTLSPRFYSRFRLGDLMSRINSDVSDIQRVTADTLLSVISNMMMLTGCVGIMLWLDWKLFVISVVVIPGCVLLFLYYQRRITALTRQMRARGADLGCMLVDSLMGMRVITSLNAGEQEVSRFHKCNTAFVSVMMRMQVASFMAGAVPGTLLTATTSGVVIYGGAQIIMGKMTVGTLVAFMTYQMRLFGPVQTLMGLVSGLSSARVSLARILELFEMRADVVDSPDPVALTRVARELRVTDVSLRHETREVLKRVNLLVPQGAFCAVLGPSGAGKSTLADLIVRNLDPDSGRITVDGIDIRDVKLSDVHREILLVDQSPHLFNDTILANITFAFPAASEADVARVVRLAGLEHLVARLPHGLRTQVGERGLALSAGERHRVALARALLRHPSVLILDEPTAALDGETEQLVAKGLRAAFPGTTLIVITHKPALAAMADMVVTLREGHVDVERPALHAHA